MKKNISYLILELFKDKNIFENLGFSSFEADVFYYLIRGHSIHKIAAQLEVSNTSVRNIRDRRFHLIPIYIKRKLSFLADSKLNKINDQLTDLDLAINDYLDYFNQAKNREIRELGLSSRTLNSLSAGKVKYLDDLIALSKQDLLNFKNIGAQSIQEIEAALSNIALSLKQV